MSDDGAVVVRARANLWRERESVGGHLYLTRHRLSFRPHALNFQTQPLDLPLAQIASTRAHRSMGIIPNGLTVVTTFGTEYRFVTTHRDRFIAGIEAGRRE
jgi:hypothetical protein